MKYLLICDVADASGVYLARGGRLVCRGDLILIPYNPSFDFSTVDPVLIVGYFSGGLLLYVTFWALSVALKSIFNLIR